MHKHSTNQHFFSNRSNWRGWQKLVRPNLKMAQSNINIVQTNVIKTFQSDELTVLVARYIFFGNQVNETTEEKGFTAQNSKNVA